MNANKLRGTIAERKALRLFREAGYDGLRSPLSVSKTDLLIKVANLPYGIETLVVGIVIMYQ